MVRRITKTVIFAWQVVYIAAFLAAAGLLVLAAQLPFVGSWINHWYSHRPLDDN